MFFSGVYKLHHVLSHLLKCFTSLPKTPRHGTSISSAKILPNAGEAASFRQSRPRRQGGLQLAHGISIYLDVSKNSGFSPQIIHFNRVFIIFTIHVGGNTPIFGNTHLAYPPGETHIAVSGNSPKFQYEIHLEMGGIFQPTMFSCPECMAQCIL